MNIFARLLRSDDEVDREELQKESGAAGCQAIQSCAQSAKVHVAGVVRSTTCYSQAPQRLEAELFDGSGSVWLVWLGRRVIPGIEAGRHLEASGRIFEKDGRRILFNPRYGLRAPQ